MDTFKINISKVHKDSQTPFSVTTNRGREHLYDFWPSDVSDDVWYFFIPEAQGKKTWVHSDSIPVQHIIEFARSLITIRYGIVGFDIQFTSQAKRLLGAK